MAVRDLGVRGPSTIILDPNIILENPDDNYRDMDSLEAIAHIREMADSIIESGNESFPPINIYQDGDKVCVSAGWCRRRAHVLAMQEGAPIKGILCLTMPNKKPEDLTLAILTSNDGLPLTQLAKAKAIKRLQSFMWTPAEIAKKIGRSASYVNDLITFHDSPDAILDMVKSGQVSASLATKLVKEEGSEKAQEMLEGAIESAGKKGKGKATQGDLEKVKKASVPWGKFGPKLYKALSAIYECPINMRKEKLDKLIASAADVLADVETEMSKVGE
jgi:ParB family chromosome partitioning protein